MEIYLVIEMIENEENLNFDCRAFKDLDGAEKFIRSNPTKDIYVSKLELE